MIVNSLRGHGSRRTIVSVIASAVALATMVALSPGAVASPLAAKPRAAGLTVQSSVVAFEQAYPLPKANAASWTISAYAVVKVSGIKPGQSVAVSCVASDGLITGTQIPIAPDGTISIVAGVARYASLAEANANATRFTSPITIEVRATPNSAPLTVVATNWPVIKPMFFSGVAMTQKGNVATFTGKLLDGNGKPVKSSVVAAAQFTNQGVSVTASNSVTVDKNGAFKISVSFAKAGSVALRSFVDMGGSGHGAAYSKLFTYKP